MSTYKKIDCIHNDQGAWCTNKNIKRSLLGLGARCCSEYDERPIVCILKEKRSKKGLPPSPIRKL